MDARRAGEDEWGHLLALAQGGDEGAYSRFLREALPYLRVMARRFGGDRVEEVEDVVQDALLTIHRVRHTYDKARPVKPWLTAIVARRAIDARRRRGRKEARERYDPESYETYAGVPAKENQLLTGSIDQMLATLTPQQRQAVRLVKLEELSVAEASERSGQSVSALKVNVHRALKKLRLAFGGREPE